ncbi:TPA: hypothetical protein KSK88_001905 [Clostridioides difficile]|nr:hypothetical protein [Clostridioides difficile]HEK4953697.1 hypothetical protein [Clostridioides difficile]
MQKKISEMSILEKVDLISKKQKRLQEKYKNISRGELFSIACNEVKKIEEQEEKYFEYR